MAAIIQPTAIAAATTAIHPFRPTENSFFCPLRLTVISPQPPGPPLPSIAPFKPNRRRQHPHQHRLHFSISTAQPSLSNAQSFKTPAPLGSPNGSASLQSDSESVFDSDKLFSALRLAVKYNDIDFTRAVHATILKLEEDTLLFNAVIVAYLKLGIALDPYRVFRGLAYPDVASYSALISNFAKSNREIEAINLFFEMMSSGIEPNGYSFVALLTACMRMLDLELGLQVHSFAIKLGYSKRVFVANALMGLYGKCGFFDCVVKMFDEMTERDIASWNTVMSSMVEGLSYEKALELFCTLQQTDRFRFDEYTLSTLLSACIGCHAVEQGREIHAHSIRIGLETNLTMNNALIGFYTRCGNLKDVLALFEKLPVRDVVTWTGMVTAYMEFGLVDLAMDIFNGMPKRNSVSYNALLAGFCQNGEGLKALELFIKMLKEGVELTDFTLTSAIDACGLLMTSKVSREMHGFVVKFGFGSNACIEAALLDMCTRCGTMKDAEKMFYRWPYEEDSSIIQTSMLCGYARNGLPDEAMSLFHRSQSEGTMALDEVALTSVLGICGTLGFHEMGKQIHSHAIKTGFVGDLGVGNSIISMYSKCCNMNDAIKSFKIMPAHDVVSWNGLIAGHLLHRQGDDALAVWSRMVKADIKPDAVTFVLTISAHKHTSSNLVDHCRSIFLSLKTIHDIEPASEHYASLVGVLGYWGLLEDAEEMIIKMPFEPEIAVWRALLDSCRLHSNVSIGKRVAKRIVEMEPRDPSTYVLISNLYSASGWWRCSEIVRENMRERQLRKNPARSWIIHQEKVHSFHARDKTHPQTKDIYSGLDILILECLKSGYEPDTSFVLHEVEEHQKKDFLFYHSAKLAATYGLLMTRPGETIRIVKNILLCGDCHTFLKHVSVVTRREIILRDTSGFHCFSNGQCSCKDYW